ncbi:DNA-directed DNA/RNA polymerase mu [Hyperolius riggenbachi]|uniref:DNA-directed DNA/RNA polymerase mu n=1 Tax=Hyperolius riggenbachi TaxID=752182 RepID=UPI0035A39FB0
MLPIPVKRRKKESPTPNDLHAPPGLFPGLCIFLVERRMGAARRGFLTALAQRKGFTVAPEFSDGVTHVVSEQNSLDEVLSWLERKTGRAGQCAGEQRSPHYLDISWFTESMSSGRPVSVEDRHCLQGIMPAPSSDKADLSTIQPYGCQRRTPLIHHNAQITDVLEILARAASFQGSEVRQLGFTRAASVLKSLPFPLQSAKEAEDLPMCGGHCKAVIREILEDGVCREAEELKASEHYQCMELFTSIFGVGVQTAERWYKDGARNLKDLQGLNLKLTEEQRAGLEHFTDLRLPVTLGEADRIEDLVRGALQKFVPDIQITMTGGFRRGKQQGHDVDFLITHPDDSTLTGLLKNAVDWMDSKGLLLYQHMKKRSHAPPRTNKGGMDGHETCYAIFALPASNVEESKSEVPGVSLNGSCASDVPSHDWRAVRVDLVVTPHSEYPYALLGWTGSKHFERELRRFTWDKKKLTLNSHGLHDAGKKCFISATSEEDIFTYLGLQYVPPSDRNA